MAPFTIQDVARRTGLSEPTLRYYEDAGLLGPIARDHRSGHRRYTDADLTTVEILSCLRAVGAGIDDMRTYLSNRARGVAAAADQRDLLLRHAARVEAEIAAQRTRLTYLREKAALWDARHRRDPDGEAAALARLTSATDHLLEVAR